MFLGLVHTFQYRLNNSAFLCYKRILHAEPLFVRPSDYRFYAYTVVRAGSLELLFSQVLIYLCSQVFRRIHLMRETYGLRRRRSVDIYRTVQSALGRDDCGLSEAVGILLLQAVDSSHYRRRDVRTRYLYKQLRASRKRDYTVQYMCRLLTFLADALTFSSDNIHRIKHSLCSLVEFIPIFRRQGQGSSFGGHIESFAALPVIDVNPSEELGQQITGLGFSLLRITGRDTAYGDTVQLLHAVRVVHHRTGTYPVLRRLPAVYCNRSRLEQTCDLGQRALRRTGQLSYKLVHKQLMKPALRPAHKDTQLLCRPVG